MWLIAEFIIIIVLQIKNSEKQIFTDIWIYLYQVSESIHYYSQG